MPRTYERWIFTKAREYSPDGTLQVGQILVDPFDPSYSLMPGGPLPVPEGIKKEHSYQTNVAVDSKEDLAVIFGLWVSVAGLPVGVNVGANASRSEELSWHFDKLTGLIISPSLQYVKDSLNHGDVPSYTKRWRFSHRLYIITGVRTVHGARLKRKAAQSMGVNQSAEADLSETGAPVSLGEKAEFKKGSEISESFEVASDFVYAYRLSEVNYWGEVSHRPYTKGQLQGEEEEEYDSEDEEDGDNDKEDAEHVELHTNGLGEEFDGEGRQDVKKFKLESVEDEEVGYEFLMAGEAVGESDGAQGSA